MNQYYFAVTFYNSPSQESYKDSPVQAETYSQALEFLYSNRAIIGARVVAVRAWTGTWYTKQADLFRPAAYDVPDLTQF